MYHYVHFYECVHNEWMDKTFPNLISTAMRYDYYDYDSKVWKLLWAYT